MPYGVHFVQEQENPVGFWLWRIATAIQDAQQASDEVSNLQTDVESSAFHGLADDIPGVAGHVRHDDQSLDLLASEDAAATAAMPAQLAAAQKLAEGRDPHDQETITALQQIYAQVAAVRDSAQTDADTAAGDIEKHAF